MKKPSKSSLDPPLKRSSTGIDGLDAMTGGGLPSGRTTLLLGGPSLGKILMAFKGPRA